MTVYLKKNNLINGEIVYKYSKILFLTLILLVSCSKDDDKPEASKVKDYSQMKNDQKAEEVIQRAITARASKISYSEIKTVILDMSLENLQSASPLKIYMKNPNKMRVELTSDEYEVSFAFSDSTGWGYNPEQKVYEDIPIENIDELKDQFREPVEFIIAPLYQYVKNARVIKQYVGKEKDGNIDADVIRLIDPDTTDNNLFGGEYMLVYVNSQDNIDYKYILKPLDEANDSLLKVMNLKENKMVGDYIVPHLIEFSVENEIVSTFFLKKIQINEKIDDKIFLKPKK